MFRASFRSKAGTGGTNFFFSSPQSAFASGAKSVFYMGRDLTRRHCSRARDSASTRGFVDPTLFLSSAVSSCAVVGALSMSGVTSEPSAARATSLSSAKEMDLSFLAGLEAQLANLPHPMTVLFATSGNCGAVPLTRLLSYEELESSQTSE